MKKSREMGRKQRHRRVRRKITGTEQRARLNVFRSHLHIYAALVDDLQGRTLVSASSLKLETPAPGKGETKRIAVAKAVGRELAARAREKGIEKVSFDRSGYRYHGRVAALAQGAREGGLQF
jgi:large subunit ribosomal protein L18